MEEGGGGWVGGVGGGQERGMRGGEGEETEGEKGRRRAVERMGWARAQGAHEAMHERVMDAYWSEGRDIGDWDELAALVTDAGLDPEEARVAVDSGAFAAMVDGSTATAQRHGITAVPAFVLDGRLLVSGAQPHEVFTKALEQVAVMREKDGAPTD